MADVQTLPLLPLRDIVVFPGIIVPLFISRERSIKALFNAKNTKTKQYILLVTQRDQSKEIPEADDLYQVGVMAKIIQTIALPNKSIKVLVEAIHRVDLSSIFYDECLNADYEIIADSDTENVKALDAITIKAMYLFNEYAENNKKISPEVLTIINNQKNAPFTINVLASHIISPLNMKQALLEETSILKRANVLVEFMTMEIKHVDTENIIHHRAKKQIEKTQREYYLNEQMKAIQRELDGGEEKSDFYDIEIKMKKLKLSTEAREKATSDLKKLKSMNQMSAEASVIRNYLDILLSLPWNKFDKYKIDIKKTEAILNRDHFGLEKVKERVIEYLAILQRSKTIKGPILCFIGPPGIGKTSLVKSIAEAMGRKYTKFALGGVRDEAEIRGHRKTYIGSMPGKIITLIKKAKISNPVMLLDEIDKMESDFRGDPASALLEVLDPEQNSHFVDHYLEVEYDLSKITFIATANSYNLPRALRDRMEIIEISGYIEEEKMQIAKRYLAPKQLKLHEMKDDELIIPDDTILELIRYYTKESGVRGLEREIGSLTRKALKRILNRDDKEIPKTIIIHPSDLEEYLGTKKYRFGLAIGENQIGVTTGLAYTEVGGELLTIEAVSFQGKGEIKSTGKLGDVMKESAQAAYSCFRTRSQALGLKYEDYKDLDIHLHVPEGAVPKDGPSAGIAIFITIVSLMTKNPVRGGVAMTGEITLSGKILPIGGLKEKLLAAKRGGVTTVLIPEDNVRDLKDISINIKDNLRIIAVSDIDQALKEALVH